jgi:hypothetical protein
MQYQLYTAALDAGAQWHPVTTRHRWRARTVKLGLWLLMLLLALGLSFHLLAPDMSDEHHAQQAHAGQRALGASLVDSGNSFDDAPPTSSSSIASEKAASATLPASGSRNMADMPARPVALPAKSSSNIQDRPDVPMAPPAKVVVNKPDTPAGPAALPARTSSLNMPDKPSAPPLAPAARVALSIPDKPATVAAQPAAATGGSHAVDRAKPAPASSRPGAPVQAACSEALRAMQLCDMPVR